MRAGRLIFVAAVSVILLASSFVAVLQISPGNRDEVSPVGAERSQRADHGPYVLRANRNVSHSPDGATNWIERESLSSPTDKPHGYRYEDIHVDGGSGEPTCAFVLDSDGIVYRRDNGPVEWGNPAFTWWSHERTPTNTTVNALNAPGRVNHTARNLSVDSNEHSFVGITGGSPIVWNAERLYAYGEYDNGYLGFEAEVHQPWPEEPTVPPGEMPSDFHVYVLTKNGSVYRTDKATFPSGDWTFCGAMPDPSTSYVDITVDAWEFHVYVLMNNGSVYRFNTTNWGTPSAVWGKCPTDPGVTTNSFVAIDVDPYDWFLYTLQNTGIVWQRLVGFVTYPPFDYFTTQTPWLPSVTITLYLTGAVSQSWTGITVDSLCVFVQHADNDVYMTWSFDGVNWYLVADNGIGPLNQMDPSTAYTGIDLVDNTDFYQPPLAKMPHVFMLKNDGNAHAWVGDGATFPPPLGGFSYLGGLWVPCGDNGAPGSLYPWNSDSNLERSFSWVSVTAATSGADPDTCLMAALSADGHVMGSDDGGMTWGQLGDLYGNDSSWVSCAWDNSTERIYCLRNDGLIAHVDPENGSVNASVHGLPTGQDPNFVSVACTDQGTLLVLTRNGTVHSASSSRDWDWSVLASAQDNDTAWVCTETQLEANDTVSILQRDGRVETSSISSPAFSQLVGSDTDGSWVALCTDTRLGVTFTLRNDGTVNSYSGATKTSTSQSMPTMDPSNVDLTLPLYSYPWGDDPTPPVPTITGARPSNETINTVDIQINCTIANASRIANTHVIVHYLGARLVVNITMSHVSGQTWSAVWQDSSDLPDGTFRLEFNTENEYGFSDALNTTFTKDNAPDDGKKKHTWIFPLVLLVVAIAAASWWLTKGQHRTRGGKPIPRKKGARRTRKK